MLAILALAACKREPVSPLKAASYAEGMCGGRPSWAAPGSESGELMTYNHVQVTQSGTLWNGVAIDRATLNYYLEQVRALSPQPITALVPDSKAKCDDVESVRRTMETRLRCSVEKTCVEYPNQEWLKRHPPVP